MEALNIILSTQLVIIIFLSSSVSPIPSKKLQGSILPNPPKPSSDRIIFNTVMKGIIKRLASIAGKDGTYTLDESTVRKLKEIFPSKEFVIKLLEELKGGRTMDEFAFVTFLEQNNGFLEKALKICLYGQNGTLFDKYMMIEMFSLSEADAFSAIDHGVMITPKRLAKRLFQYAGITEKDAEQVEIFDKFIKGIMTRLTLIANGGSSAQEPVETLGESTVSKLNRKYPNNAFVQKLLKEVQGGKALDREGFVQFLIQNAG
ncbi:uncharacterized protein LOC111059185 isoform X2 [Nilaparvata lugens]|uniref:uncharacterized protein LOC111059185 isoform X2 n=1 Tax=Nilaparvata lugens TaxID=108931 RepID=UPI00193E8442|nr:uncharacterized protein LOC111059185 isoform X2 [Nilaparvata lugens]